MKINFKKNLKRRSLILGWMTIPSTVIAEIQAKAGFDGVIVDLEHSAIDVNNLEALFQVIEANGKAPLVRLSDNDPVLIKRVLDLGAHGIIVPMVNSPEEAELAVKSAKYPPEGFRSTGIYRAQDYGSSFKDYRFSANDNIAVIIQIEHKDAVESIDEILSVKGIDGIMVGPYDLSSSYGIAGHLTHPVMKKAINKVFGSAKRHKIKIGTHVVEPSLKLLKEARNRFSFVVYSNDTIILNEHFREVLKKV